MSEIALLGVDWGSTSVRAFAIAPDGTIVDTNRADDGVFARAGNFASRLRHLLGDWQTRWPGAPVLLCGMIGSDRGWVHAPYVAAPAAAEDLAAALVPVPFDVPARIVPGISHVDGDTREVMRGEETLLMGLGVDAPRVRVCLPGTHTKWVDLVDGRIVSFRTHMTGELRALVLGQGALAAAAPQIASAQAFHAGLVASQADPSLARSLFQARARRLLGTLEAAHTASFVSGILIGRELAGERETAAHNVPIILAARGSLADEYGAALRHSNFTFAQIDPEPRAAQGLLRLARRAKPPRIGSM